MVGEVWRMVRQWGYCGDSVVGGQCGGSVVGECGGSVVGGQCGGGVWGKCGGSVVDGGTVWWGDSVVGRAPKKFYS